MELLVVAYPVLTERDYNLIETYREAGDPQRGIIKPHFTLAFPIAGLALRTFTEEVRSQSKGVPSFSFDLNTCIVHKDIISGDFYAFLVPGQGSEQITNLHNRLYSDALRLHKRADIPYIPHITIGRSPDVAICERTADSWNSRGTRIQGRIESIDLISYENGAVTPIENIRLL